jgi:hypothetical protein
VMLGLGCRSASYILYGVLSTLVWMMLLTSSILTFYSTNTPAQLSRRYLASKLNLRFRVTRFLAICLRRFGKMIAILNTLWILATSILQFTGSYDRCYCNSSVLGLGKSAYNVIALTPGDTASMTNACIGGIALAAVTALGFAARIGLLIDPPLPP